MAVTTVVKTIGTSSRNYSTLQAWEDDAPVDLTTAERWNAGTFVGTFIQGETVTGTGLTAGKFLDSDGSSYITFGIVTGNTNTLVTLTGNTSGATCVVSTKTFTGIIWQGQTYNDSEFVKTSDTVPALTISGETVSSTCYVELTTASGQSFQNNVNVRTNALTYNASNGVAIRRIGAYGTATLRNDIPYSRLSLVQVTGNVPLNWGNAGGSNTGVVLKNLITYAVVGGETWGYSNVLAINILAICDFAGSTGPRIRNSGTAVGCSIIRTTNRTPAGTGFDVEYGGSKVLQSCTVFGFTTAVGSGYGGASSNNATDLASGLPGTSNQHSVTYNATTPFTQASNSATDMRSIGSTALAANGLLDATNAPKDISGYTRANPPTIGHWELTAVANTNPYRITTLGVG